MRARLAFRALAVAAALAGSAGLGLSSAAAAVAVAPDSPFATLVLGTVPVIENARVIIDGSTYLTDASGTVTIPTVSGDHRIKILPPVRHPAYAGVSFIRWMDGIAQADRVLTISPGTHDVKVGFEVSQAIAIRFTDEAGRPIPSGLVTQVTVANSIGQQFTFSPSHPPRALAVNRVVRDQTGLHPLQIRYSVRQVIVGGSNVVYSGRQNFFVQRQRTWTVKVLLFSMRVRVRDALFGFPIGSAVRVTRLGGASRIVPLGSDHAVTLTGLPRATYQLAAEGLGFGLSAPSTLSKPQDAKLLLFSWVDVAAVCGFFALFAVGLPVLGGRVRRRKGRIWLPVWHADRTAESRQAAATTGEAPGTNGDARPGAEAGAEADTEVIASAEASEGTS